MAAKSDFAQKLLHDLRLRKERMGVAQGSGHTNATARDAYRNPGNVQRGSRHTKSLEIIGGAKTMNQQSDRALSINESSKQLVSYGGGQHQRAESIGDLSMAFTYAVKNGGKIMNMDFSNLCSTNTMIDFLHQIGRRSLDVENTRNGTMTSLVKHRPSSGGVVAAPALTTIQIKEISKGVQNLYEIIRSGSNGTSVNKYSMEVGKELLKGAKGLEESLRMLVSLQEASEMMVSPQRKSRVTLLEVDDDTEEDRSKVVDRNQVALPRFSFDKPSRRTNLALPDGSSKVSGHRRSASFGAESVRSVSTAKNTSNRSEKGRISNVIAKLMGLEEVPGKVERDECKIIEDSSKSIVNKTTRPEKESVVPLNDRKSQQIHEMDTNRASRTRESNNNNRLEQVPKKHERQMKGEPKEKLQHKRRGPEDGESLRVDKKKTIRKEKSNEIKLVPRSNQTQQPEKRTQKSKHDSQQLKQVKYMSSASKELQTRPFEQNPKAKELQTRPFEQNPKAKEPQTRPFEQNPKAKDPTPKTQVFDKTERYMQPPVVKEKPMIRKKENVLPVRNTEAPRLNDEVLKRRNRTVNTLAAPTKHKLSVLKETKIKDVTVRLKPEETKSKMSNSKKPGSAIRVDDMTSQVPVFDNKIKSDPQPASEIVVAGAREKIIEVVQMSENKPKKAFYSNIRVVLNEDEKQLKEILIKDQLFLSTAKALFRLNIPVGFLHVDDHNHHRDETKLKRDCGYEILKRKARSQELSVHPYVKPSISGTTIRFLDELVKQLYKDLESLRAYGRNAHNEYDEADYLHHMLERDIYNTNPDINSFWDFGWHITTFSFVEKDEFVNDVEEDVLRILVDEIVDDLMKVSLPF